jgi:hypothetical protein
MKPRALIFLTSFLILLLPTLHTYAKKVATFTDILTPYNLLVDKDRLYINESATIYIFSLKDYSLVKKFGKKGEGPGEFKLDDDNTVFVSLLPDHLLINSVGRISYFSKEGTFIKEIPNRSGRWLKPLDDYFVGMRIWYDKKDTRFRTVCIFDSQLNRIKDIYSEVHGIQPRRRTIDAISWPSSWNYLTYGDKVFVMGKENKLHIFNKHGESISTVKLDYEPLKLTDSIKEEYIKYYRDTDPYWRARWERLKSWYVFPDYLPVARYFKIKNDKIYILTYKKEKGKKEFLILDLKGKLLKKVFLPLVSVDALGEMPFDFQGDLLYQLVINEDTEELELHTDKIK